MVLALRDGYPWELLSKALRDQYRGHASEPAGQPLGVPTELLALQQHASPGKRKAPDAAPSAKLPKVVKAIENGNAETPASSASGGCADAKGNDSADDGIYVAETDFGGVSLQMPVLKMPALKLQIALGGNRLDILCGGNSDIGSRR